MLSSAIDHLVVTAPALASGIQYVEQTLGCKMQPGGQHPRMGTHNALLKIGDKTYLEVISIDPDAEPPRRKRWFELDTLLPETRPRLASWVMRTNDIDRVTNATDLELGVVEEMSRGTLEWQITIPPDGRLPSHGIAPAVIQWKGEAHPALKLAESSVSLLQVVGYHPDARQITALLNAASFEGPFSVVEPSDGIAPGLTATFQTQRGVVVLS
jgi:hypothetical protein